ncbi:MAG: FAD-binding oxidoreductase [Actinobacteria bacterium]|nr:MAG: FAD-binding oxidoreductase [Actinomycetota bacterium]
MTTVTALDTERIEAVSATLSGALFLPGHEHYDAARQVHNGLIDKRPALIARCLGTADVVAAIELAHETGLEISVRGGGHSVAGRAVAEGGLMIDLAEMKGIHVDPVARTARAQGGVIWRELNREAAVHGLATTGGAISTTGIAGFTLGGGLGWLMSKYGLATDNLLSAEIVTATGEVLQPSANEHSDLFWAIRGGGGNFGVATSFEYRLHPVSTVFGGLIAYPFDSAPDVLRLFREFTATASDDASMFAGLVHAPDGSGVKLSALLLCHTGTLEDAEAEFKPVLEFGSPVMTHVGAIPYPAMNMLLDEGYPKGALNYWKSTFIRALEDDALDALVASFAECPSPMDAIVIEHFHGEVTRIPAAETAVPHRTESYNVLIPGEWIDPADTDGNIAWVRETYAALQPYSADRRWLNYFADDDGADAVRAAYGPNFERLVEIKKRYDPDNVFHLNHNIEPG